MLFQRSLYVFFLPAPFLPSLLPWRPVLWRGVSTWSHGVVRHGVVFPTGDGRTDGRRVIYRGVGCPAFVFLFVFMFTPTLTIHLFT